MLNNVIQTALIDAAPERLFDMYLDSASHAAFTGQPATVDPRAGGAFRAFDNVLSGTILHVEPKRLIVQTWRSKNFPSAARDSVLILNFLSQQKGARIEVVQIDIPDEDLAGVSEGWEKFYWMPLRAYVAAHPAP